MERKKTGPVSYFFSCSCTLAVRDLKQLNASEYCSRQKMPAWHWSFEIFWGGKHMYLYFFPFYESNSVFADPTYRQTAVSHSPHMQSSSPSPSFISVYVNARGEREGKQSLDTHQENRGDHKYEIRQIS